LKEHAYRRLVKEIHDRTSKTKHLAEYYPKIPAKISPPTDFIGKWPLTDKTDYEKNWMPAARYTCVITSTRIYIWHPFLQNYVAARCQSQKK
jgi:hypothetical protein